MAVGWEGDGKIWLQHKGTIATAEESRDSVIRGELG